MNGMLPNHELHREIVDRHQSEARRWACERRLARLARSDSEPVGGHQRGAHILAMVGPAAALLALSLVLI